jgi:hypothetical protein
VQVWPETCWRQRKNNTFSTTGVWVGVNVSRVHFHGDSFSWPKHDPGNLN